MGAKFRSGFGRRWNASCGKYTLSAAIAFPVSCGEEGPRVTLLKRLPRQPKRPIEGLRIAKLHPRLLDRRFQIFLKVGQNTVVQMLPHIRPGEGVRLARV